jgi:hypothetical protein
VKPRVREAGAERRVGGVAAGEADVFEAEKVMSEMSADDIFVVGVSVKIPALDAFAETSVESE